MLEQKVPGKIKCNVLPRAVAAPPGTFDAVRNGLADISFAVHGYTPSRFVTTADWPSSRFSATRRRRCRWRSSASTPSTRRSPKSTRA